MLGKQDSATPHATIQLRTSKNGNPSIIIEIEGIFLDLSNRTHHEDNQSHNIPQIKDPRPQRHKIKILHQNLNTTAKPHGSIPLNGL